MKLIYKKILWAFVGIAVYAFILFIGAIIFVNVNIATMFWGVIYPLFMIAVACLGGAIFWNKAYYLTDPPEYDLDLLVHEVINQMEADFDSKDMEALDEMIKCLIKQDRPNHDILYQYLSDTGQQNLKEGLTAKRWEDE